ncbi:MAG: GDSL-type esterase/lipase family protein [Oliverpabstia sp.]
MKWVSSFRYLPINYGISLAKVENQTQRVVFENNLDGEKIRLRFSNRYSGKTLTLQSVSVGTVINDQIQNVQPVSRNANTVVMLAPGEECWSDELYYPVEAGKKLAVSVYVKDCQEIESISILWSREGAIVTNSESGDFTQGGDFTDFPAEEIYPMVKADANKGMCFYGFTGLQVYTGDAVRTIAAFGDSITHMSYVTNALSKRLFSEYPGKAALLNCGIGGNRLLHDATYVDMPAIGNGSCFGIAGITRFEQDVFGEEQVDAVLVLEGINDIMHPIQFDHPDEMVTPAELETGYQTLIEIAHRHGAKIYGATILPCGHKDYPEPWMEQFEALRMDTNSRIRNGVGYDGYFDYCLAVQDDNRLEYMQERYHIGDGLHPNDAGGQAIAEQIDLKKIME